MAREGVVVAGAKVLSPHSTSESPERPALATCRRDAL